MVSLIYHFFCFFLQENNNNLCFLAFLATFKGDEEKLSVAMLPTFESENEEDVGEIDYTYFVSIDIEEFRSIVKELGDDDEGKI